MRAYLKFILTRTFVLYLVCLCLILRILNYDALVNNAVPQTMSRLTVPIDYFAEFVDKEDHYNYFNLMDCINYHKAVAHFFAFQKSEAYGMLGFCYERLGETQESLSSYQQAVASNPDYFWPYYDLGVISYNQAQYIKAANYFQQALQQNPLKTIVLLSRSKIYNDVKLSKLDGNYDYLQGLKQGHLQSYILLMDSLYKTAAYEELWKIAVSGIKEGLDSQGIFYYYAGAAAFHLKSYQKAVEFLQAALQDDPLNSDALLYMGMCLQMAGKQDLGQMVLNKAALLHKQGADILEPCLKVRARFF